MEEEVNAKKTAISFILEFVKTGLKVIVVVAVLRIFIIQPFYVRGDSMTPNFQEGEYLVVEKLSYRVSEPKRGDVIVFKFPRQETCGTFVGTECINFIKRVVGLPGERVEIRDGRVFIYNKENPNGFELREPYLPLPEQYPTSGFDSQEIGEREFYVLGDNRLPGGSSDSRDWGLVHKSLIAGRVFITVFPLDQLGVKTTVKYPTA